MRLESSSFLQEERRPELTDKTETSPGRVYSAWRGCFLINRKRKIRTVKQKTLITISVLTMIAGVLIMLYPAVSSLVNARSQSQVIDGYVEEVEQFSEEENARLWEAADAFNDKLKGSKVVMTDPFSEEAVRVTSAEYEQVLNVDGKGMMGYIDIPKIKVHIPILHGTSESVLARAVGHLQGTSLPIGGDTTHSVLSAHTGLAEARLFTDLDQMKEGDIFTVTILNEILTYQVVKIEIVEPSDISSLRIEEGRDLCTLVTCTPYGINTHRLLVHGERIETPEKEPESEITLTPEMTEKEQWLRYIDPLIRHWEYLAIGGALFILAFILLIILISKRRQKKRNIRELWRALRENG